MDSALKNIKLKNRIFLAPMEEVNDIAFRLLCKKAGCGLTYTGMISPLSKKKINLQDKPGLQLFCTDTKGIKEFMEKHDKKVSLWDFNLGCSAKTAKKHGFGSFLRDLKVIENILRIMRKNTKKPLTLKMRKSDIAFDILKIAEKYCDAVCIHPRTYNQGYSVEPDLEFAEEIKSKTRLLVIYSGNVNEKNCREFLNKFDYVMIGREAIGRPEIFANLTHTSFKKSFKDYLKLAKKYSLPFRQIKFQAMNFTKGLRNSTKLRLEIFKVKNTKELEKWGSLEKNLQW
ncbi:MAG: tRNA-dihydrouridine synthase family protein [Candidatus Pacearchaeota archaeon]|nr:tRNA-dihydrouridine synthase family protein [Candidatus Pacearchaeota archaeon]